MNEEDLLKVDADELNKDIERLSAREVCSDPNFLDIRRMSAAGNLEPQSAEKLRKNK
jgi:hypothetical protein